MSSGIVFVWMAALLAAAGGLLLWQRAHVTRERTLTDVFVERQVAPVQGRGQSNAAQKKRNAASASASAARPASTPVAGAALQGVRAQLRQHAARASFVVANLMSRAGVVRPRVFVMSSTVVIGVISLWVGIRSQWMIGVAFVGVGTCCAYAVLTWRAQKRHQRIARQLPVFLDGIVRLITIGNSVPAAFQAALVTTEAPLRECLDRVSRMLRSGVEIDVALTQMARVYHVRELELIGSVLRISVKYGGRSDVMLDRMASLMRDLEQADRELVALSTETRMSSWILGLLPVLLAGFVIVAHPSYFNAMWSDPFGKQLVFIALGLQLSGGFLLYRLARLRT